nr:hypothetical protein [Mycobacterium pseudoshottsii]
MPTGAAGTAGASQSLGPGLTASPGCPSGAAFATLAADVTRLVPVAAGPADTPGAAATAMTSHPAWAVAGRATLAARAARTASPAYEGDCAGAAGASVTTATGGSGKPADGGPTLATLTAVTTNTADVTKV